MIKRITLTKEHIALLKLIKFVDYDKLNTLSVNKEDPYILGGRLEDIAIALGYENSIIPGSEDDAEGAAFPDDIEGHLVSLHKYIVNNIRDIETIIHQFIDSGVKPGTYKCIDTEEIWTKE